MDAYIRLATVEDAQAISNVVISALRQSNTKDYPADVIARVEQNFSPLAIERLMVRRRMYVASVDQRVVATASLDGDVIRSVFVAPRYQRAGLGRRLMSVICSAALDMGLVTLHVPSSITAESFYTELGFQKVRDEFDGAERTIIMRKSMMETTPTIQTRRLILTPLQLADAPAIQQLFPHWEVVRYLDSRVPWPYPEDGALTYVRDHALPAIASGREWHWMIRTCEDPAHCIGSISLYDQPGNNRGFWLAPQWQGKGYMREACEVINTYWFETLGRPAMQVPKAVGNHASRKVSEHEGMRMIATRQGDFVCGSLLKEVWEMTRGDWLEKKAALASR